MESHAVFDPHEFEDFLSGQPDLGSKSTPRFIRVSTNLPVTGSNKVLKRDLRAQSWRCDDPVFRWVGRGAPVYHPMSRADKDDLVREFQIAGRQRLL
jgi:fatty-acyl-CoA synthase